MEKFVLPLLATVAAMIGAALLDFIVHYGLGIARATIRTDALTGAAFIGLALVGGALVRRDK